MSVEKFSLVYSISFVHIITTTEGKGLCMVFPRYEFRLPNGLHVVAAAAAAAGQLYLASGAAPDTRWAAASPRLRPAIASFQLGASAGRV